MRWMESPGKWKAKRCGRVIDCNVKARPFVQRERKGGGGESKRRNH